MKTITKSMLLGLFGIVALGVSTVSAVTTTLVNATFDNLSLGAVTYTNPVSGVLPLYQPTTGSYLGSNTATVITNGVSDNWLEINKIPAPSGNPLDFRFWLNTADTVKSNQVAFSFQLMISTNVSPTGIFSIAIRNSGGKVVSSLGLFADGKLNLNGYKTNGGDNTIGDGSPALLVDSLTRGPTYSINMLLDLDTGKSIASVNGGASVSQNFAADGTYGIRGIDFSSGSTITGKWYLDDVYMASIPEPATIGLLFGALALLTILKKRKN